MNLPWISEFDLRNPELVQRTISALELILPKLSEGVILSPERVIVTTNNSYPERQMLTGLATWNERDLACVKIATLTPENPGTGRPLINGLVIVMDLTVGQPIMLVDGGALTGLRTGAVAGLALRHLSEDVDVLSIVGAGVQARWALMALLGERRFRNVRLASRGRTRRNALANWLQEQLSEDQSLVVCESIEDAVRDADVVCTATSISEPNPVVISSWLKKSALCIALGGTNERACEIDPDWVKEAQVFVEDRDEAIKDAGEIRALSLPHSALTPIADVITGSVRPDFHSRRLFRSVGLSAEDLAGVIATLECFGNPPAN